MGLQWGIYSKIDLQGAPMCRKDQGWTPVRLGHQMLTNGMNLANLLMQKKLPIS
jgi:hypothetical protein